MSWFPPDRCRRRPLGAMVLLIALVLAPPESDAQAQSAKDRELLLKAAFLYNFAKFVEWPPAAFAGPNAPLRVCVHSASAFEVIAATMDGKTVGNRSLTVIDHRRDPAQAACHITFIGAEEPESSYADHLKAPYALTVGDRERFARTGGMVGLVTVDNKIRFEVNLRTARAAGLSIQANCCGLPRT